MKIETVQDINKGISGTSIITVNGELVSNYTGQARAGHNFKRDLDTKDIAKLIRQHIKEAGLTKKNGYKISVTSDSYSGGSSIDIRIKEMPFQTYTPEYQEYNQLPWGQERIDWISNKHCEISDIVELKTWEYHLFNSDDAEYGIYTANAKLIYNFLDNLLESYRRDDSDSMIDYFDCNFYGHVQFSN